MHTAQPDMVRLTIADYEGQRWQVPQLQDVLWPDGDFGERWGFTFSTRFRPSYTRWCCTARTLHGL